MTLFNTWKRRGVTLVQYAAQGLEKDRKTFMELDLRAVKLIRNTVKRNSTHGFKLTPIYFIPPVAEIRYAEERIGYRRLSKFCDSLNSLSRTSTDFIIQMAELERLLDKIKNDKTVSITEVEGLMEAHARSVGFRDVGDMLSYIREPYGKKDKTLRDRFHDIMFEKTTENLLHILQGLSKPSQTDRDIVDEYKNTHKTFDDRLSVEKGVPTYKLYISRANYYANKALSSQYLNPPMQPDFLEVIDQRKEVPNEVPPPPRHDALVVLHDKLTSLTERTEKDKAEKNYHFAYEQSMLKLSEYWSLIFEKLTQRLAIEGAYDNDVKMANHGMGKEVERYAKSYIKYASKFNGASSLVALVEIYLTANDDERVRNDELNLIRTHISDLLTKIMVRWTGNRSLPYFNVFGNLVQKERNPLDVLRELSLVKEWPRDVEEYGVLRLVKLSAMYFIMLSCV